MTESGITAEQIWGWLAKALIVAFVAASLAWAGNEKKQDESILTLQNNYVHINEQLDRIEKKLDEIAQREYIWLSGNPPSKQSRQQ